MYLVKYTNGIIIRHDSQKITLQKKKSSKSSEITLSESANRLLETVAHANNSRIIRGKIINFSKKSSKRLRDFLMRIRAPEGQEVISLTLTLPYNISDEEWRKTLNRYRSYLTSRGHSLIWRVELQTRKVPHLHCIGFAGNISDVGDYWIGWLKSAPSEMLRHEFFSLYGVNVQFLRGSNWYVYMLEHMSKKKESQLGWQGRQWGIFNRSSLCFDEGEKMSIDENSVLEKLRDIGYDTDEFTCHFSRFGNQDDDLIKSLLDCVTPF